VGIVKILIGVVVAILKGTVAAFLAVASLGLAWLIGIGALIFVVVAGVSGLSGWRTFKKK
jgi:hypothetical protein